VNVILGLPSSGKTNVHRALYWLTDNRPLGFGFHSRFADKKEPTEVTLTTDENVIRHTKTDKEAYYYLDEQSWKTGKEIPDEIVHALNMSETNFQKQLDIPFLITSAPGEVARVINRITKLDKADEWIQTVTSIINELNRENRKHEADKKEKEEELKRYADVKALEKHVIIAEQLNTDLMKEVMTNDSLSKLVLTYESVINKIKGIKIPKEVILLSVENLVKKLEKDIAAHELLTDLILDYNDIEKEIQEQETITASEKSIVSAESLLVQIETFSKEIFAIEGFILDIEDKETKIGFQQKEVNQAQEKYNTFKKEFEQYLKELGKCPTCYQDLDSRTIKRLAEGEI